MSEYNLISSEDISNLSRGEIIKYYKDHVSPGLANFMKILGFDMVEIDHAEGMYIHTKCGRKILDFSGGLSVLNHGHNHPRILKVRKKFNEEKRLEICKAFISPYQSVLARNLSEIFPGDLKYTFFCNSGAEANEGALKSALLYHGKSKDKIVYTDTGYHGKTFGAMSVSGPGGYKELFKTIDGCIEVPYGDIDAVKKLFEERSRNGKNDIAAMILEAIDGDHVVIPPEGYLKALALLCRRYGVIMIIDEIFTGFGKTGKMFAFEHEGIIPDIVTFSKSLGGGKASIAGYIVTSRIFKATYASMKRCTVHTTTFGGLGEECATAIEALNVINDEGLVENAREKGHYLLSRMLHLKDKYPGYIENIRGIGLLCLVELRKATEIFDYELIKKIPNIDDMLTGLIPALIISDLFRTFDTLVYPGGRSDVLLLSPALIVTRDEIDTFVNALDRTLSKNLVKLASGMIIGSR